MTINHFTLSFVVGRLANPCTVWQSTTSHYPLLGVDWPTRVLYDNQPLHVILCCGQIGQPVYCMTINHFTLSFVGGRLANPCTVWQSTTSRYPLLWVDWPTRVLYDNQPLHVILYYGQIGQPVYCMTINHFTLSFIMGRLANPCTVWQSTTSRYPLLWADWPTRVLYDNQPLHVILYYGQIGQPVYCMTINHFMLSFIMGRLANPCTVWQSTTSHYPLLGADWPTRVLYDNQPLHVILYYG